MDKTNHLKILNTPIEEINEAIRLLRNYCTKDNVGKPFDKLEFVELFYLVQIHADTNKIPIGLVAYLNEYAIIEEERILEEVEEEGGYYELAEDDIWVAKQVISLGNYYLDNISRRGDTWAPMIVALFEIFPELDDIEVLEAQD